MAEQLALFGGTFDPVHHGHVIVARALAERRGFRRVTFVPAAIAPHKAGGRGGGSTGPESAAPADDRLEMIRLAIAGEELFEVSDIELERGPPSYTIDTLEQFRGLHGPGVRLFWIVGADMLDDLPNWRRADEVVELATIVTATRLPHSQRVSATMERLAGRFTPAQVSRLREGLADTPTIDISSSEIRRRVAEGKSIKYLTAAAVVDYIRYRRLYAPPGGE